MKYAKLIEDNKLEYAPKNYGNIINFDLSEDLMRENGFLPYTEILIPEYDETYQIVKHTYKKTKSNITDVWTITDFRTKEEAEAEKEKQEKEAKIQELKEKLTEIDNKSIRAIRDNDTEYIEKYRLEALEIREKLQELIN